jgi:transcriptional regulator with XRE-family HTH domain
MDHGTQEGSAYRLVRFSGEWRCGSTVPTGLAARIGADAAQISRGENGRILADADVIRRLAETFDQLLLDDTPRRPTTDLATPRRPASPN